jgi:hypothetical protein
MRAGASRETLTGCRFAASSSTTTAIVAWAGSSSAADNAVGQPPPEWAANADAWPAHNYDLANTRATTRTPINSRTVSKLKVKWRFRLSGTSSSKDREAERPVAWRGRRLRILGSIAD